MYNTRQYDNNMQPNNLHQNLNDICDSHVHKITWSICDMWEATTLCVDKQYGGT